MKKHAGCCNFEVVDKEKGVRFLLFLMYPTFSPSKSVRIGPFSIQATLGAPVKKGAFPLVVISHGSGGTHLGYLTIAQHLAENGYIVAMPEHYCNNRNDNRLEGTKENLENRPRHISLVIDKLCSDSKFKDHIQKNNTAVIGHSMGGYTALSVAGGSPWTQSREKIEVTPDNRVKGIVLMAPATLWFTPEKSLANVKIPVMMMIAEHDPYAPREHADLVLRDIKETQMKFSVIKNSGHFSFLSPFPKSMNHPDFLPSTDPEGFNREVFHSFLKGEILTFLNSVLTQKQI